MNLRQDITNQLVSEERHYNTQLITKGHFIRQSNVSEKTEKLLT